MVERNKRDEPKIVNEFQLKQGEGMMSSLATALQGRYTLFWLG
jgi:hypothetical protein